MTDEQTYNEILSIREMAQMLVQNTDRIIKKMQASEKIHNRVQRDYLEHKARLRARRNNKVKN